MDGGFVADATGNELVVFGQTANAINEIKITNAAAGSGPIIEAQGGSTDVGLNIVTKGVGAVNINKGLSVGGATTLNGNVSVGGSLTVGGSSLSFTTLINDTPLTSAGNYIVNVNENTKIFTLPNTQNVIGSLITIYSPSHGYKLAIGNTQAPIAANTVTVCIATSTTAWVAYASGVPVTFQVV